MKKNHEILFANTLDQAAGLSVEAKAVNESNAQTYEKPQRFSLGTAVDLVQSSGYGAYEDRYTRYKWNR